jgi:RNA polymerase sigma-70 factor (ECF subfamily)
VLGHDAVAIASAFLAAPTAMGQRLVRAKARIRALGLSFEDPEPCALPERLRAVLDAIYASFGLAWADPASGGARALSDEAIWLARLVVALAPEEAEPRGLLALILHAHARRDARRDASGAYVPLDAQEPGRWDMRMVAEAEATLRGAAALAAPGRYQIEAAIQSAHAARAWGPPTPPRALLALYDALMRTAPSMGAAIGRAAALGTGEGEGMGPDPALAALDALDRTQADRHQPYWAVRAELLARAGRAVEARAAFGRAIGLSDDPALRRFLSGRRASLG